MSNNTILATAPLTTTNYILKATGTTIGNSLIWDNGTNVGIGNTNTSYTLDVSGTLRTTGNSILASTSGNVGIGITPYTWNSIFVGIDFVNKGGVNSYTNYLALSQNMYYGTGALDGWRYKTTGYAAAINLESSSGNIVFRNTSTSGTADAALTWQDRMTILANGNVGIGTSSPPSYSGYTVLALNNATNGGVIDFQNNGTRVATINNDSTSFAIGSITSVPMIFYTGGTERMRITSGGFIKASNNGTYFSATGAYHEFRNTNTNATDNVAIITSLGSTSNNTSNYHNISATNGADKLYIYGNGNVVNINGSYGTLSDIELKENIVNATPKLDNLLQLKVRNFNLIDDEFKTKQIGFIAQEFEEVFPSMIDIDGKSGMKTIKTSVLIPMLVKAIQELSKQNEELSNRLIKLESK